MGLLSLKLSVVADFLRPVVLYGALGAHCASKLVSQYSYMYSNPTPSRNGKEKRILKVSETLGLTTYQQIE